MDVMMQCIGEATKKMRALYGENKRAILDWDRTHFLTKRYCI